ncbi:hypothetical protein [Bifidobacterium biavatii]|uniref:Lipoprotein n=1 Tax=Bifidobacterium biavatii DSM 23969 TaxID=1437608 RepID=A0A086ZNL0_9BIFI|nr:hypothetical protein [Bifidobacterium biavatii]KFI48110.1 hypothetical protein BBIA_0245 [Bifidobacterium biavatii DSM 23969]
MSVREIMRKRLRILSVAFVLVVVSATAACSDAQDAKQAATNETSAGGARIASSRSDYIEQLLQENDKATYPMADSQLEMLKRALNNDGKISTSDYERSWSDYSQCIMDRGWSKPVLNHFPNGIIDNSGMNLGGLTEQQHKQVMQDVIECSNLYTVGVDAVYGMQVGNPSLWQDLDQAIVDCLHKNNLVSKEYDADQYQKDFNNRGKGETVLNFDDMSVRGCLAANGSTLSNQSDELWDPTT